MGGYVFGLLGRAPEQGDEIEDDGLRLKVVDLEGTRIERLEVEFLPSLRARSRPSNAPRRPDHHRRAISALHRLGP